MKKLLLATLVAASIPAFAHEYVVRIPDIGVSGSSSELPLEYSDWRDVGDIYNCGAPYPLASSVNLGESFEQTKKCDQKRERDVTKKVKDDFSGAIIIESITVEPGTYKKDLTSQETGTKNYEVSEEVGEWSEYVGTEEYTNCLMKMNNVGSGSNEIFYNDNLILTYVSRDGYIHKYKKQCDEKLVSTKHIYSLMADGTKVIKSTETKDKLVNVTPTNEYDTRIGVYNPSSTHITIREQDYYGSISYFAEAKINRHTVWESYKAFNSKAELLAELKAHGYKLGELQSTRSRNGYKYFHHTFIQIAK